MCLGTQTGTQKTPRLRTVVPWIVGMDESYSLALVALPDSPRSLAPPPERGGLLLDCRSGEEGPFGNGMGLHVRARLEPGAVAMPRRE